MKTLFSILLILIFVSLAAATYPDGNLIMKKIDDNMLSKTSKSNTTMIVNGTRASRTLVSQDWSQGKDKAYSEYLSPPREKGTKMLKDGDNLWIYDPGTDRIVQISGNMLRQSVMGSDLSYEDFMEETSMEESYNALVTGETTYENRDCWILKLTAKKLSISYQSRLIYVDKERDLPLYEERYAKNGKLLKTAIVQEVMKVGNKWYPKKMLYKDVLKQGKGTQFIFNSIQFDIPVPASVFTKASLKG
jgi:outer membrane lipoprotein-sorting protein